MYKGKTHNFKYLKMEIMRKYKACSISRLTQALVKLRDGPLTVPLAPEDLQETGFVSTDPQILQGQKGPMRFKEQLGSILGSTEKIKSNTLLVDGNRKSVV